MAIHTFHIGFIGDVKMKIAKISIFILIIFLLLNIVYSKECGYGISCECGDILTSSKQLSILDTLTNCDENGLAINDDNIKLSCFESNITSVKNSVYSGIIISGNNVSIENCNIQGFYKGIEVRNSENSKISSNILNNNFGSGIDLYNASKTQIFQNIIKNNNWAGIYMIFSHKNIIYNNTIEENRINGIQIDLSSHYNIIKQNSLKFNSGHAIAPKSCNNQIVDMTNIGGNGKPIKYADNKINLLIKGNNYSEIIFCNVISSIIESVNITNGKDKTDGILIINSDRIMILNSYFDNTRAGIYLYNTTNSLMYKNYFKDNDFNIRIMESSNNNFISKNNFSISKANMIRINNSKHNSMTSNIFGGNKLDLEYNENIDIYYNSELKTVGDVRIIKSIERDIINLNTINYKIIIRRILLVIVLILSLLIVYFNINSR